MEIREKAVAARVESVKVSIVTAVRNNVVTIEDAILSVASQSYNNIEHIIVDGASTDGTIDVIENYQGKSTKVISEPDRGIYDAMNKGLRLVSGDVIGFLNADDMYTDDTVIEDVIHTMSVQQVDAVFGDLVIVARDNLKRVVRYYESKSFNADMIGKGCMPAHPTLFFRKNVFEKYGYFKIDYVIAADFEFVARVFGKGDISYHYIPRVMVKMRTGGASTKNLKSNWILNKEILRACRENDIKTNMGKIFLKYPRKIWGLIKLDKT